MLFRSHLPSSLYVGWVFLPCTPVCHHPRYPACGRGPDELTSEQEGLALENGSSQPLLQSWQCFRGLDQTQKSGSQEPGEEPEEEPKVKTQWPRSADEPGLYMAQTGDPAAEEWSPWSVCSLTCGQGLQVRTRSCVSSPYGTLCSGPLRETRPCNNSATCPGEEDPWLPSWVDSSLPVRVSTGSVLCELGLEVCVFHIPTPHKGRNPGAQGRSNEEQWQSCRSS
ncbi:hypothetical protein J1605_001087 [Eschrichtius robustus]|uniref:Uncharacterized protein n=1 Tax=Eschrichtius robustus TaxID=9764 RepID=A0AB34GNM2_ESCRO|nr:hypothetical protein J1605_001087 [Eschrichtius robustus]